MTIINPLAFGYCRYLSNVTMGSRVTSIGQSAFRYCVELTEISLPNSVTTIGVDAFAESGIEYIKLPTALTQIGNGAFWMSAIKSINIPDNVKVIGDRAFYDCENLKMVIVGKNVTTIGDGALAGNYKNGGIKIFNRSKLKIEPGYSKDVVVDVPNSFVENDFLFNKNDDNTYSLIAYTGIDTNITLPDKCKKYYGYSIGSYAFEYSSDITSITIPNSITSFGSGAFYGCSKLKEVHISDIAAWCNFDFDYSSSNPLYYAKNLYFNGELVTELVIPDTVTEIKDYAFYGCSCINSVEIPDSVTSIGTYAFSYCSTLTSIKSLIPADKLFIPGEDAFYQVDKNLCTLYVPYGAKETYASTEGWNEFTNIVELAPTDITITINQYGNATYCSPYALDFSEVEGLKAYAATGYNKATQVVTLTRLQTAEAGVGLFLKGEPGEYVVPVIEYSNDYTLNLLVGTLEATTVNSTDGEMSNYKFTIADGDAAPMFYPFEDNTAFSAGKAYLQIPTALLPVTVQKSLNIRFDEGETTDIDEVNDELKGESGKVKTIYDLSGRVVENPTSGIYIVDGKKVIIK